jgi:ABC-type multidrug transport system permease subunit
MVRILAIWLLMMVLAIGNGGFREGFLNPKLGAATAHLVSTGILVLLILLVCWSSLGFMEVETASAALRTGAIWMALTLGFEFLGGHYVFGNPWSKILADYNLLAGRIWVFVPIATLLGPWLALSLRR